MKVWEETKEGDTNISPRPQSNEVIIPIGVEGVQTGFTHGNPVIGQGRFLSLKILLR